VPSVRSQLTSRKGDADELAIHSDRVALTGEIARGGEARRPGSYSPEIPTLSPDNPQSSLTLGKTALPSQRRNIRSGLAPEAVPRSDPSLCNPQGRVSAWSAPYPVAHANQGSALTESVSGARRPGQQIERRKS
jgi:hypothetical protein